MNDMTQVIIPKSDQISADDLIAGPMTITITGIDIRPGTEQPVSVMFEDDNGRPWKPCKSMSRVLVAAWGPDAKAYVGRAVTLYRDPTVKWGGMEVGGIRISHMSDLDRAVTLALTATKGSRKPFVVKPLAAAKPAKKPKTLTELLAEFERDLMAASDAVAADEIKAAFNVEMALEKLTNGALTRLRAILAASDARFLPVDNDPLMDGAQEP
jgi:hypothetical protein